MKIAKTNRDEVRSNSLTVPMTDQEKKDIKKVADSMGISMSTFARWVIKDFLKRGEQ